jgi:hypothetical protein
MRYTFRRMIATWVRSPKKLFLLDGIGALLTAILLLIIRTAFREDFGMPANILGFLILIACIFCSYSFGCFFLIHNHWRFFLRIITIANLLYACTTGFLILYFNREMTSLGLTYFTLEIGVILALVIIELKVLLKSKERLLQTKQER